MQKELVLLLVDDDEDEYILLKDMLGRVPASPDPTVYTLDWAVDLKSALEASAQKPYDVHFVDYHLGSNTGLDLLRAWVELGSNVPVIFLTGQGNYDVDLQAMQEGASDYLVKDRLTTYTLERAIRYTLERKRARDELEMRVRERTRELAAANENLMVEIAARERVEQALRASETRLRVLAETTSAAIFIIQDQQIRYANTAARFITGYDLTELAGMKFWQLAHPAYQDSLRRGGLIRQWIAGVPARFEMKILTKTGKERWVDITAGEMDYDGGPASIITAFDITERDQAEKELQTAKAELETRVEERTSELRQANYQLQAVLSQLETEQLRLRTIIEYAPGAIVMADNQGRIVLANPVAEQIIGQSIPYGEEFHTQSDLNICYPDGRPYQPNEMILVRAALYGEIFTNVEMMVCLPNGERRFILSNAAPVTNSKGQRDGAIIVFQDITARKQREQEMQENALRAEVLATLSQTFAQAGLDYQTVLNTIAHKITENLADGCIIRLLSEDGQWLEPVAIEFNRPEIKSVFASPPDLMREPVQGTLFGQIVLAGQPLVMLKTNTKEVTSILRSEIAPIYGTMEIQSMLIEPLRTQHRIIGTLTAIRLIPGSAYTEHDQAFFEDLAGRAAMAIENATLHSEVKQLALRDSLTGQYNRRAFFELGREEVNLFRQNQQALSAIMLDIDNFKSINDRFGHALGDQILRMVIDHCRENIRHTDILGRYGGDEYAILLPKTSLSTANRIAIRIRNAIAGTPFMTEAGPVNVSVSLGVTEADQNITDIHSLLERTDQALYSAKRLGRNRVETI